MGPPALVDRGSPVVDLRVVDGLSSSPRGTAYRGSRAASSQCAGDGSAGGDPTGGEATGASGGPHATGLSPPGRADEAHTGDSSRPDARRTCARCSFVRRAHTGPSGRDACAGSCTPPAGAAAHDIGSANPEQRNGISQRRPSGRRSDGRAGSLQAAAGDPRRPPPAQHRCRRSGALSGSRRRKCAGRTDRAHQRS